jgi:hypothetical protein
MEVPMRWSLFLPVVVCACTVPFPIGSDVEPDPLDQRPGNVVNRPLDVLVVLDNSGSMCEEHVNLMDGLFDPERCPIEDVSRVPEQFMYTTQNLEVVQEEVEPNCGLAQVLAAYQVDTRIGFITTDVSDCDNSLQQANLDQFLPFNCFGETIEDRGRVPQRGCLQAAPGAARSFVQTTDPDFQRRLRDNVAHIGTWGSGFERGLDAARIFLTPGSDRAPGCDGDLEEFIREDARLLVLFVSDEDDCSHGSDFTDENVNITCAEGVQETFVGNAGDCYARADDLTPVEDFVEFLEGLKPDPADVYAMVTAGVGDVAGQVRPLGCRATQDGYSAACTPSLGASNIPSRCGPDGEIQNCCEADAASRYVELAGAMDANTSTICDANLAEDLVSMAVRIVETP